MGRSNVIRSEKDGYDLRRSMVDIGCGYSRLKYEIKVKVECIRIDLHAYGSPPPTNLAQG